MSTLTNIENNLVESTDKLAESLENLGNTKSDFKGLIRELKNVKKGTAEWAQKMHEARTQMLDIFETYPELRKYTETVNGITVLTDEGWAQYEKALLDTYYGQM
jgi:DNA repair ATPase RecN